MVSQVILNEKQIILFDGVCNLCNSSVNFVIDRDKKDHFRFAALQSEEGKNLMQKHGLDTSYFDSIVLFKNGKVYKKSTAALHVAQKLGGFWPLTGVFFILPAFLRDVFYDIVAKYRYSWFGKKDECRIPSPELKAKFL